jgi:hypothetical protein
MVFMMDPEDIKHDRTLRASPKVLTMWHCTGKLDEEIPSLPTIIWEQQSFGSWKFLTTTMGLLVTPLPLSRGVKRVSTYHLKKNLLTHKKVQHSMYNFHNNWKSQIWIHVDTFECDKSFFFGIVVEKISFLYANNITIATRFWAYHNWATFVGFLFTYCAFLLCPLKNARDFPFGTLYYHYCKTLHNLW